MPETPITEDERLYDIADGICPNTGDNCGALEDMRRINDDRISSRTRILPIVGLSILTSPEDIIWSDRKGQLIRRVLDLDCVGSCALANVDFETIMLDLD